MNRINSLTQATTIEKNEKPQVNRKEIKFHAKEIPSRHVKTIKIHAKSITVAKLLSLLVPGLGLIYLNKVGLGLRYFLTVAFMYMAHIYFVGLNFLPAYEAYAVSFFFLTGSLVTWAASIFETSKICNRYYRDVNKIKKHLQSYHGINVVS